MSKVCLLCIVFCLFGCSKSDKDDAKSALAEYEEVYEQCSKKLKMIKQKYKNAKGSNKGESQGHLHGQSHNQDESDDDFAHAMILEAWKDDFKLIEEAKVIELEDANKIAEHYGSTMADHNKDSHEHGHDSTNKSSEAEEGEVNLEASSDVNAAEHDNVHISKSAESEQKAHDNKADLEHKTAEQDLKQDLKNHEQVSTISTESGHNAHDDNKKIQENNFSQKEFDINKISEHDVDPNVISDKDIVLGDRNAKVVVIEYSSFSCPHCGYFQEKFFHKIDFDFIKTNKIAYVLREFISNKQDMDATALARCGNKIYGLGIYSTLRNILFAKQESWAFNRNSSEILTNIGQIAGISPEEYAKCVEDQELQTFLLKHSKRVFQIPGFHGTPFFIVNGEPLRKPFNNLYDVITEKLKEAN